jgi:CheY-like chemotaxis protein/anti-sigma regulatory factor (Ser/Thr protein kinase)
MLNRLLGEKVSVRLALDPDVSNIRIDRGQLAQVLMNLCLNARDAMGPDGGKLVIETRSGRGEAWLIVSDTGSGMPEHVKSRVFDPFFTTKEVGKGTGLGLSVVHGIVQQAGGNIEVESELGKGSTFRLRFPALTCPLVESQRIAVIPRPSGSERVLLVDDDRHLRVTAARSLRLHGFEVLEATSGAEALEKLQDSEGPVSLLITDIVMPAMNGPDLAQAAVKEFPGLRVLYTSGYSSDEVVRQTIMQSEGEFLAKPFGSAALVTKVRALLDT